MNNELVRFFNSINFEDKENIFENASVLKVILKKKEELFEVNLVNDSVIEYKYVKKLFDAAKKGINGEKKCVIKMNYKNISEESINDYVKQLILALVEKRPSLISLKDSNIVIDDEIISIEVNTKNEEELILKECKWFNTTLKNYGLGEFTITTVFNKENNESIINEINAIKNSGQEEAPVVKENSNMVLGRHVDGEVTTISNIMGDMKNVIIEAYVFGKDNMERETINIITLKISDKTNSILAKVFKKDKNEYKAVDKQIKEGNWYRFHGNIEFDNFSKDLVLAIRNIESIDTKDEILKDEAEEKRVELHTHTMMSAMDGVIDAKSLVKHATKIGQKAIAVTDHNCCQAFPDLYHAVCDYNKGKEGCDRFKVLYGAEMNIVNDDVDLIFNNKEYNLLEDTFVVFDTETTGFYAGSDQMIEIGAVKVQKGNIIDRFDELIDPKRPLPKKITELTFITDEMLKGKDSEENVTRRFLEWAGNLPMVAHNAKFDISFMKAAFNKYNLGDFDYTVLDTMSLARMMHPEWTNHKLQTLTKK